MSNLNNRQSLITESALNGENFSDSIEFRKMMVSEICGNRNFKQKAGQYSHLASIIYYCVLLFPNVESSSRQVIILKQSNYYPYRPVLNYPIPENYSSKM